MLIHINALLEVSYWIKCQPCLAIQIENHWQCQYAEHYLHVTSYFVDQGPIIYHTALQFRYEYTLGMLGA